MIRKSMPSDLIRWWVPVFPRDKREAFARRSCSNKKMERDDDSKKDHPALAPCAVVLSLPARKCRSAYPNRSLLRRCLDICSISQSIHTNAMPKPTTTPKNSNVRAGAVSMVNIHKSKQTPYQRVATKRPRCRIHQGRGNHAAVSNFI